MARCPYHQATGDCAGSGSTFTVAFIRNPERPKEA
jgi:hypothetical protein